MTAVQERPLRYDLRHDGCCRFRWWCNECNHAVENPASHNAEHVRAAESAPSPEEADRG